MKPMDHQRVQRLIEDTGSLLRWHEYHQKGKRWSGCTTIANEENIVASLHILRSVICAQLSESPNVDEDLYLKVVNALKLIQAWHHLHKKEGCFFKTQGEDGHIEWLASTLYDLTQEPQYNEVIIDALRTKLAEARPDLLRLFPDAEEV